MAISSLVFDGIGVVDSAAINVFFTYCKGSWSLVDMLILLPFAVAIPTSAMAGHWIDRAGRPLLRRRQTNESK